MEQNLENNPIAALFEIWRTILKSIRPGDYRALYVYRKEVQESIYLFGLAQRPDKEALELSAIARADSDCYYSDKPWTHIPPSFLVDSSPGLSSLIPTSRLFYFGNVSY